MHIFTGLVWRWSGGHCGHSAAVSLML